MSFPQLLPRTLIAVAACVGLAAGSSADEGSLAEKMPPGAIGFLEVHGLDDAVDMVVNSTVVKELKESPYWDQLDQNPQLRRAKAAVKIARNQLGSDPIEALRSLLGRQVAGAAYLAEGKERPDFVVVARSHDAEVLADVEDRLITFVELANPEIVHRSKTPTGAKMVSLDNKVFYCVHGEYAAVSSQRDMLEDVALLISGEDGASLSEDSGFRDTVGKDKSDHLIRGFINSGRVIAITHAADRPRKLDNALGSLLFGGMIEFGVHSKTIGLAADLTDAGLKIDVKLDCDASEISDSYMGFFRQEGPNKLISIPDSPEILGGFCAYRDLSTLYNQREQLIQERALPGFDKFETGLANLLPGRDFGQDVLSTLGKHYTFVVSRQSFDYLDGKPGIQLPAFAIVAELAKPEGSLLFQLLYQTVVGITNIQAGQQGRQPMLQTVEEHNGVQISYGKFMEKPKGDHLPVGFNFTPASAQVGDYFIFSSSAELCRTLVDHVKSEAAGDEPKNLGVKVFPAHIAQILEDNRKIFQARMIQDGRQPDQAERELSLGLRLLKRLKSVELSQAVDKDVFTTRLSLTWE